MITARRATDQKEVTRNSSHFKKLKDPLGTVTPETEPVSLNEQTSLDFEGPEVCQPTPTTATHEEPVQPTPSESKGH